MKSEVTVVALSQATPGKVHAEVVVSTTEEEELGNREVLVHTIRAMAILTLRAAGLSPRYATRGRLFQATGKPCSYTFVADTFPGRASTRVAKPMTKGHTDGR